MGRILVTSHDERLIRHDTNFISNGTCTIRISFNLEEGNISLPVLVSKFPKVVLYLIGG